MFGYHFALVSRLHQLSTGVDAVWDKMNMWNSILFWPDSVSLSAVVISSSMPSVHFS